MPERRGSEMRILLVEDDQLLGDSVSQALDAEGYAVAWLRDGDQAAAALATWRRFIMTDMAVLQRATVRRAKAPSAPATAVSRTRAQSAR